MKPLFQIMYKGFLALALFVVLIFVLIKMQSEPYIKTVANEKELPTSQTAIVLGAGLLISGGLSPIFKDRIDIAISLYKEGKVKRILVTGDDGTPTHNEVNPARDYLLTQGIPDKNIFLDHAGFDTYSSMYRAREIFLVDSAIIVTQSFHLPRSIFIAQRLGIKAYGIPADQHAYSFKNNIREVFADVRAVFDVMYSRKPKYLGGEIPITGSGFESI